MKNEEETLDRCILSVLAVQRSRGGSEGHAASAVYRTSRSASSDACAKTEGRNSCTSSIRDPVSRELD